MPTLSMSSSLTPSHTLTESISQAESISGHYLKRPYKGIWAFLNWWVRFAHGFLSQWNSLIVVCLAVFCFIFWCNVLSEAYKGSKSAHIPEWRYNKSLKANTT